jgi:hypothetical protein
MDSDSQQEARYCLQYIILGNCTHPAQCKDFIHENEEEKTQETRKEKKISQTESLKNDPEPQTQVVGAQFLVARDQLKTSETITPNSNIAYQNTNTGEQKKEKKKLQLKKNNEFTPIPTEIQQEIPTQIQQEIPNEIPLKSTKSIDSTKISEADSFNVEAFYENLDPEDDGADFDYYNPDHKNGYSGGYNNNYQQPEPEDYYNDDLAYFHKSSADCSCCKGYVNSCDGGICDNLGYCYCYAQEMEETG